MHERLDHRRRSPGWRRPLILLGVALAAMTFVAPAVSAADGRAALAVGLATPHDGIFRSTCLPSLVAMDDPIVHPGVPGASHQHGRDRQSAGRKLAGRRELGSLLGVQDGVVSHQAAHVSGRIFEEQAQKNAAS